MASAKPNPFENIKEKNKPLSMVGKPNPFDTIKPENTVEGDENKIVTPVRDDDGTVIGERHHKLTLDMIANKTKEAARLGWLNTNEVAARVNKGIVNVADLPLVMVNGVSQMLGGPKITQELKDIEYVKRATNTGRRIDNEAAKIALDATEFFAGGGAFAKLAQGALHARQVAGGLESTGKKLLELVTNKAPAGRVGAGGGTFMPQTMGDKVGQSLAQFSTKVEAGASLGAATAGNQVEDPYWKAAAELFGGVAGGGIATSPLLYGKLVSKHKKQAADYVNKALENPSDADAKMRVAREGLAPVESVESIGLNSLFHKILRRDLQAQNDYHNYVKRQQAYLADEVEDAFRLADEDLGEGVFQSFLSMHKNFHLEAQDQIILQAKEDILTAQALGGIETDQVAFSIAAAERMDSAVQDIAGFRRKLWDVAKAAGTDVDANTTDVVTVAREIVNDFPKNYTPPSDLKKQLEYVTGEMLTQGQDGWKLAPRVVDEGEVSSPFPTLRSFEAVDELQQNRSVWEAAKRKFKSGESEDLVAARYFTKLSESAMDSLTNTSMVGAEYSASLQTALEFTRREKQLLRSGRLGKTQTVGPAGVENVTPEEFAPTVFGGNIFTRGAAARNIDELEALQKQSTGGPVNTKGAFEDFILAKGQKALKEGPTEAQNFLEDHKSMLNRFPRAKLTLQQGLADLVDARGRIKGAEVEAKSLERDPVYELIEIPGENVATFLLSNPNVGVSVKRVMDKIGDNPVAVDALKRDIMIGIQRKLLPPEDVAKATTIQEVMEKNKKLLNSELFTKSDRKLMNEVANELVLRARTRYKGDIGNEPPVKASLFKRLTGKLAATHAVSALSHGPGALIVAGTASRAGEEILSAAPVRAVERIIADAMLDSKKMAELRSFTNQKQQDVSLINLVRNPYPAIASDLQEVYEETYDEPFPKENQQSSKPTTMEKANAIEGRFVGQ